MTNSNENNFNATIGNTVLVAGFFRNQTKMTEEIKNQAKDFFTKALKQKEYFYNIMESSKSIEEAHERLKNELKEWESQEVKERFERVNSQLHIVTINELKCKIKRLKRGEDI